MKKQIVVIHGGETFSTYENYMRFLKNHKLDFERIKFNVKKWKETLGGKLGKKFEVIYPKLPNKTNAKYKEWKIMFDKYLPFLENNLILIGHSLGGIFLAKYLSENKFPKKITAVFLVAAPYDAKGSGYSLADFTLPASLEKFQKQCDKIFLFYSKDDPFMSFNDFKKYKKDLPEAKTLIFKNRGHFDQIRFPEIIREIKKLYK